MRKHRRLTGALALLLAVVLMAAALPARASAMGADVNFADVPSSEWYAKYVQQCAKYEIINGYPDGLFHPDDYVKRGEFIKLLFTVGELYTTKNDTSIHWAAPYWNALKDAGVLEDVDIPCTYAGLEANITRYEMAALIRNLVFNIYGERPVQLANPDTNIGDYKYISMGDRSAVEQAYGKGILMGIDSSGSFGGDQLLTRAQAAKVVVTAAWPAERAAVSFATEVEPSVKAEDSFAFQYRNMSTEQRRLALFGDANKSYFTSASDAGNNVVTIEVKTWDINSSGAKYTRTWTLQVHRLVADEVKAIFEEIYNDPEKFPIHALGGARYSDTMRHSWGCAIDINPTENYYINYKTGQTTGSFCYLNGSSPYCITPDSSVVRAFAKYGWGWGGSGWTSSADYMHFSILSSGG